jgi:hypothetical protein
VDLRRDGLKRYEFPETLETARPVEVRVVDRLVRIIERIAPRNRWVRRHRLRALAAEYEHDTAVLEASQRVTRVLGELVDLGGVPSEVAAQCRETYERHASEAMARIDATAEHFPEYVEAVQRQTARRIALDGETHAVEQLAARGSIPEGVAHSVRQTVEREQRRLARQPVSELEPRPEELLARVPFFKGLDPADFQQVVNALVPRTVLAGEEIIRQGEKGTSLFLIARGVVGVIVARPGKPPKRVASLHAGEFFGEMALLSQEPRTATVVAVTGCQLYELASKDVDELCEVCPGVRDALAEAYQERRRSLARPSVVS